MKTNSQNIIYLIINAFNDIISRARRIDSKRKFNEKFQNWNKKLIRQYG